MIKLSHTLTSLAALGMLLSNQMEAGLVSSDAFVIRGTPGINDLGSGQTEFVIDGSGFKAALGTNDVNGATIGSLVDIGIIRHDDTTRFTAGSGPAVAPYLNLWVTDGLGNYAVIANEPSNGSFASFRSSGPGDGLTYNFSMADIAGEVAKVYETPGSGTGTSWVHTAVGSTGPLTFSDLFGLTVGAPSAAYILDGANGVGTGAPDVLGTNIAYGFNWVFGDTLSNYVSGDDGYIVSNFTVAAVPEPSLALFGLTGLALGLLVVRRRR